MTGATTAGPEAFPRSPLSGSGACRRRSRRFQLSASDSRRSQEHLLYILPRKPVENVQQMGLSTVGGPRQKLEPPQGYLIIEWRCALAGAISRMNRRGSAQRGAVVDFRLPAQARCLRKAGTAARSSPTDGMCRFQMKQDGRAAPRPTKPGWKSRRDRETRAARRPLSKPCYGLRTAGITRFRSFLPIRWKRCPGRGSPAPRACPSTTGASPPCPPGSA